MTAAAVILAGGKGTRSANPNKPKVAQTVGRKTLMEWHLDNLRESEITEVLVVAGYLGDQVQDLVDRIDHNGLDVKVIHEEQQRGTVSALALAAEHTRSNEFLVILGDVLVSMPVQHLLKEWRVTRASVAVVVHPSTHPEDSDAVFPTHESRVLVVPKTEQRDHIPNMSSAGLFAITRQGLRMYGQLQDFGSNVLPAAGADGDLFAFVSSHYLKDTGTPSRLEAAQRDVEFGAFARRGRRKLRPALFLDRDGVINPTKPEFYTPFRYEIIAGVAQAIREANVAGIPVIVLTNQPHIAKGLMDFNDHQAVRAKMDRLLGAEDAFVDDYYFCPHHPDSGWPGEMAGLKIECPCRKPGVGLARKAERRHLLDLRRSVMVGDTNRDREMAGSCLMKFIHVSDNCDIDGPTDCFALSAEAIRRGIEVLSCS